jgi:hypothetical protein
VPRGGGWRAARPGWRGRLAGAGAGWSRAVTDGTPSPLPGVEAAGPDAGLRCGLACSPGPPASSLHSGCPVKSPDAGPGLTPVPRPRVDAGRFPPGQAGAAPLEGWSQGGCRQGGRVACTTKVKVRATVVHAPAAGQPDTGTPAGAQRVMLLEGSVMGWLVPSAADFYA